MSPIVLTPGEALVDVERSGVVESIHRGHVVTLDADGAVTSTLGRPDQPVFGRSCNKPLQAVGLLECGLTLTSDQLALAAASHSGEPVHLAVIRSTLAAYAVDEGDLGCPPDLPLGANAARTLLASGGGPAPVHMNCSGKHAAMLAACRHRGWTSEDYLDPHHPLQQQLAATVADLAGEPIAATGVDGCGAPLFAVSLIGLARAFLRIAGAEDGPAADVGQAMRRHPDLIAGTGRTTTALMTGVPGLIAKDGADGVYVAALAGTGAVAVKIDDGAQRAADVAVIGALSRLGIRATVLDELRETPVLGGGRPVGAVRLHRGALD